MRVDEGGIERNSEYLFRVPYIGGVAVFGECSLRLWGVLWMLLSVFRFAVCVLTAPSSGARHPKGCRNVR